MLAAHIDAAGLDRRADRARDARGRAALLGGAEADACIRMLLGERAGLHEQVFLATAVEPKTSISFCAGDRGGLRDRVPTLALGAARSRGTPTRDGVIGVTTTRRVAESRTFTRPGTSRTSRSSRAGSRRSRRTPRRGDRRHAGFLDRPAPFGRSSAACCSTAHASRDSAASRSGPGRGQPASILCGGRRRSSSADDSLPFLAELTGTEGQRAARGAWHGSRWTSSSASRARPSGAGCPRGRRNGRRDARRSTT